MKKNDVSVAFYFCEACNSRHPATLPKIAAHINELKAKKMSPVFIKQGRSNVLKISRRKAD